MISHHFVLHLSCQRPKRNQGATTTSSLKQSFNSCGGIRRHRSNNLDEKLLRKSIPDGYENSALRVLMNVPQKVNLWDEVVERIYATHVSPSARNVKQLRCSYTTQQPMQVQPMEKSNDPEGRNFERYKRDAFEQNWSESFSVVVSPGDEKLEIKVARKLSQHFYARYGCKRKHCWTESLEKECLVPLIKIRLMKDGQHGIMEVLKNVHGSCQLRICLWVFSDGLFGIAKACKALALRSKIVHKSNLKKYAA